jgi:hypothetical protein
MMVACSSEEEAFYLCAYLSSCVAEAIIRGSIVLHPDTHVLRRVAIPQFDPKAPEHSRLSKLGERCHLAAKKDDLPAIEAGEEKINTSVARLWGITDNELNAIQGALAETGRSKRPAEEEEGDL